MGVISDQLSDPKVSDSVFGEVLQHTHITSMKYNYTYNP